MDAMDRLNALGHEIAREQDGVLEAQGSAMQTARAAIIDAPLPRKRRTGLILAGLGLSAAAAVAAAAVVVWVRLPVAQHMEMSVSGARVAEPEGAWVSTTERAVPVQFSDGSRIELDANSRARVVQVTSNGAYMAVESGAAHFDIVPRESANWRFSFGPFGVEVLGTKFDVSWSPEKDLFQLTLERGKVKVTGCAFGEGRAVLAGETVRASCGNHQYEISTHAATLQSAEPVRESEPATVPPVEQPPSPQVRTPANGPHAAASTWQELARANRYAEAFLAADAAGFEAECERASAADLSLLGTSARLSGHPTQAVQAYQMLRSRFAGTRAAALAAYDLARVAFDQRHAYNDAAQWFSVYLREQPRGELAREALGRLMEAQSKGGDSAAARATAVRYLDAYPSGPHAALARSLAGR